MVVLREATRGHALAVTRPWGPVVPQTPGADLGVLTLWGACKAPQWPRGTFEVPVPSKDSV